MDYMDTELLHDEPLTLPAQPAPANAADSPTHEQYAAFELAFDHFARTLFDGRLTSCLIVLDSTKPLSLGWYSPKRFIGKVGGEVSAIALNPSAFATTSVLAVLSTLAHEMAHHYQELHGKPGRARYHNREFAQIMETIGLQCSVTGKPRGATTGDSMSHYAIEGGRFLAAANELLEQTDFTIPWRDRFAYSYDDLVIAPALRDLPPEPKPALPEPGGPVGMPVSEGADVVTGDAAGEPPAAPAASDDALPSMVDPVAVPALKIEPPDGAVAGALDDAVADAGDQESSKLVVRNPRAPRSAGSRACFACSCTPPNRAWGKPSLRLHCLDCDTQMLQISGPPPRKKGAASDESEEE